MDEWEDDYSTAIQPTHLLTRKCSSCIYRPGNQMHLENGRVEEMTQRSRDQDANVICHQSKDMTGELTVNAWCAGSIEEVGHGQMIRIMNRLGLMPEMEPTKNGAK